MAAPVTSAATFNAGGNGITYASGINGEWVQVHDNMNTTVIGSAVQLNPGSYSSTLIHPLIVNFGTLVRFVVKYDDATTAVATSPSVKVYGADQVPNAAGVYPASTIFWRLDASTFAAAATAFTIDVSSASQGDGTNSYSTPYSNSGYALLGAKSVIAFHTVQPSITNTDSTVVKLLAQVINA